MRSARLTLPSKLKSPSPQRAPAFAPRCLASIAMSMLGGIILRSNLTGLKRVDPDGHSQLLENGQIVEEGPPSVVLANPTNPRTRSFLRAVLPQGVRDQGSQDTIACD